MILKTPICTQFCYVKTYIQMYYRDIVLSYKLLVFYLLKMKHYRLKI